MIQSVAQRGATFGRTALRLLGVVLVLAGAAVVAALATILPASRGREAMAQRFVPWGCRLLLAVLGVAVRRSGPLPPDGSLVVANHLSWLDILAAIATWQCTFVAKREVRHWPIVGPLGDALGVVWIERARPRDLARVMPLLESALRRGRTVLLFPEGTTSDGRSVLPFRTGLFESAVRADALVVPVALTAEASAGDAGALSWHGNETLVANIVRVASLRGARLRLQVAAPAVAGSRRKPLAHEARRQLLRRFRPIVRRPSASRQLADEAELPADRQFGTRDLGVPGDLLGIHVDGRFTESGAEEQLLGQ